MLEGPHLLAAYLDAGLKPVSVIANETSSPEIQRLAERAGVETVKLSDKVFQSIVDAEHPQGIAAEIEIPGESPTANKSCVFLEGIQDAGNVGAIIRSAAAFGIGTVVVDRACADPWSPKVLRAGTGGHFALQIRSIADLQEELGRFSGRLACTVPRDGAPLRGADLSGRFGWIFGSEGKGVSARALKEADLKITIPTAPGTESLNVAAAAAICLYEAWSLGRTS